MTCRISQDVCPLVRHFVLTVSPRRAAETLAARRHFARPSDDAGAEGGAGALEYDPRFLVFEFTYDMLLRAAQVTLVESFAHSIGAAGCAPRYSPRGIDREMAWRDEYGVAPFTTKRVTVTRRRGSVGSRVMIQFGA